MNDPKPLYCDTAMIVHSHLILSPVYGTKLQNKMWAFRQDKSVKPDVFIYLRDMDGSLWPDDLDLKITLEEMRINSNYFLVFRNSYSFLYMRKDFFKDPQKKQLLINYKKNVMEALPVPAR